MKIVFTADNHLRPYIWRSYKDICGDSYLAWQQLCEFVLNNVYSHAKGDTIFILGGDIFDSTTPSGKSENAFKSGLDILRGKVPVYFIPGNHDEEEIARPLLWDCIPLSENPIKIKDTVICGIPYTRNVELLQSKISNIPPCDFLVMHSAFKHLLGFDDMWQVQEDDIPEYIGHVLVGDIHKKDITGRIVSPGSLSVNNISEFTQEHGVWVIDTDTKEFTYKQIYTRLFANHEVDSNSTATIGTIIHAGKDPKYRQELLPVINLNYTSKQSAIVDEIKASFAGQAFFIDNIKSVEAATKFKAATATESFDVSKIYDAAFKQFLGSDPVSFNLVKDLINTETPQEVLATFIKQSTGGNNGN